MSAEIISNTKTSYTKNKRNRKKSIFSISQLLINLVLFSFGLACILPLWSIISISITCDTDLSKLGYTLIPRHFDFTGYRYILNDPTMLVNAYLVTIAVTVIGTILSLLITAGVSYVISRQDFKYKNIVSFYIFFTMLFSGGLVPWYILIKNYLHLGNNLLALIVPSLVCVWFVMLLKTFFQKTPFEIIESCYMDGANEFKIFFAIILPLSKPALATIALFIMLNYWNDWWLGMLFIEKQNLVPLQLMLYRMMSNIEYLRSHASMPGDLKTISVPLESARMSMALVAAGPMLFVFMLFQKYFIKGITVGAIKG